MVDIAELLNSFGLIDVQAAGLNSSDRNRVEHLSAYNMLNMESALNEIYTKLKFDDYIKYANYDGLNELLSPDLWPEIDELHLSIVHAKALRDADMSMLQMLLDILRNAQKDWHEYGKNMSITYDMR